MNPSPSIEKSIVHMTELVLPNHTNNLGSIFGGVLMSWMDIAAAISAQRYSGLTCVTASIDELHFLKPIRLGQVVNICARVNSVHNTSCEIAITVDGEDPQTGHRFRTTTALMTFVALDKSHRPTAMPQLHTSKAKNSDAQKRRELRLKLRKRLERALTKLK